MKIEFKKYQERKFLLFVAETDDEKKYLSLLGADGATLDGAVLRSGRPDIGDYLRFELPRLADAPVAADRMRIVRCEACNAEILHVAHETTGKPNPLNVKPTKDGNIIILENRVYKILTGQALSDARQQNLLLYTSHFSDCPNARQFRKSVRESK